ncbi:hypothetical protein ACFS07_34660 [Undibacterium arcticum]
MHRLLQKEGLGLLPQPIKEIWQVKKAKQCYKKDDEREQRKKLTWYVTAAA